MVGEVMLKGRSAPAASFLFKHLPHKEAVFAFIASKKLFPRAVLRTEARRRGRAALRRVLDGAHPTPVMGVFLLKPSAIHTEFTIFADEIRNVLIKSGILTKL